MLKLRVSILVGLAAGLVSMGGTGAGAAVTVLGFEGVNLTYPSATYAKIQNFYDGGTSSVGTSGTNFGISFAGNAVAVCLNALSGSCSNASAGGLSATSGQGALGIDSGGSTYLNFATPYTGLIAFRYQVLSNAFAVIQAFDGPNGTGTALQAPLALFNTVPGGCPTFNAPLCTLGPGGLGGVINAQSIVFSGQPGKFVFDDLTFGGGNDPGSPPADVPEPETWALLLGGFAVVGTALRRRRSALQIF